MANLKLISSAAVSPGAAGSPKKTTASSSSKKSKKSIRFQGAWEQPFSLRLDGKLALAVPVWLERVHTDFAAFGGLPVVDGGTLWFNAWSMANLLEWTDTSVCGELEPLRLRNLVNKAMESRLTRTRSPAKKTEILQLVANLAGVRIGRYSQEEYIPLEEVKQRQLREGMEHA